MKRNPLFVRDPLWKALSVTLTRILDKPHHVVFERRPVDPLGLDINALNEAASTAGWSEIFATWTDGNRNVFIRLGDVDGLQPLETVVYGTGVLLIGGPDGAARIYDRLAESLRMWIAKREDELLQSYGIGASLTKETRQPETPSVNARMIDTLTKKPESRDWTARQWGEHLGCGKSTVADQPAWKGLEAARQGVSYERMERKGRRRKHPDK
jgi:hypothetical protein